MPNNRQVNEPETASQISVFSERDRTLQSIGFMSYADYLQSDLWDWLKTTLREDPTSKQCWCCKSPTGLVWHHRNYGIAVLIGNFSNSPPVIIRLCSECHKAIHSDENQWFDMEIVERRMEELRNRFSYNDGTVPTRVALPTSLTTDFGEFSEF